MKSKKSFAFFLVGSLAVSFSSSVFASDTILVPVEVTAAVESPEKVTDLNELQKLAQKKAMTALRVACEENRSRLGYGPGVLLKKPVAETLCHPKETGMPGEFSMDVSTCVGICLRPMNP